MGERVIITSFTDQIYKDYAFQFIESFEKHWKEPLTVYYEGKEPRWSDIGDVTGLDAYLNKIRQFPLMSGRLNGQYDINYDAFMARKSFIQAHAARTMKDRVVWIDADVVTFADVPDDFLDRAFDGKMCCYLGRDWAYTESGFLGFDYRHPDCEAFLKIYLWVFQEGLIFTQPGWHDCWGFDLARRLFNKPEVFNDLAKDLKGQVGHPFINSMLGECLDHRKGKRKKSRSSRSDLVKPRTEAYWNVK